MHQVENAHYCKYAETNCSDNFKGTFVMIHITRERSTKREREMGFKDMRD